MKESTDTIRATRLFWSLVLGLGLMLGLVWALMPHTTAKAQPAFTSAPAPHLDEMEPYDGLWIASSVRSPNAVLLTPPMPGSADLAICMATERVWGMIGAGETATVTVNGTQMGAARANDIGFFWTTLYDVDGDRPSLSGGDTVAIYRNGIQKASVTLRAITGTIDVLSDIVSGTIGDVTSPISVTVYRDGDEPSMTSYSQTVSTDSPGNFTVPFSGVWDFFADDRVMVSYVENGVEVHRHIYADRMVILPPPLNNVVGWTTPGAAITVTVYLSDAMTMRTQVTLTTDESTGRYNIVSEELGEDIQENDIVFIEVDGGMVLSRTVDALDLNVDPANDRVTGQVEPGALVRGYVNDLTPLGWRSVYTTATADPSGVYTLEFGAIADVLSGQWSGVYVADDEGDDLCLWIPSSSVEVNQTWNEVSGYAPSDGLAVTLTLYSAVSDTTFTYASGMGGFGGYQFNEENDGLPDIAPGDIVTVESEGYAWQGVVQVQTVTVQSDLGTDQFAGTVETPTGRVELSGSYWQSELVPLGGSFDTLTTAASPFVAAPVGFDVNHLLGYEVAHRTADDYLERIVRRADGFGMYVLDNQVIGTLNPPGTPFTITLRDSGGGFKAQLTGSSMEPTGSTGRLDFWGDDERIEAGDRVQVQSAAGFSHTVTVPDFTISLDTDTDVVSGQGPADELLYVNVDNQGQGFVSTNGDGQFAFAVGQLQEVWGDGELEWGNRVGVEYIDEKRTWVYDQFAWPLIFAHYDMEGWNDVWGQYAIPGNDVYITVTHPVSGVIATGTATPGVCDGCAPEDYSLDFVDDIIAPGVTVTVNFGDGYVDSMTVLDIGAEANPDTDVVTVTAPVSTPVVMTAYHDLIGGWDSDEQVVGASGYVTFDLGAEGYDIIPGTGFNVHSRQDHDHNTQYSFHLLAPDLRIGKWAPGNYARPGGVQVYSIYYTNEGDEVAENALIVDTLPMSLTYADDTSGLPHVEAGGVITWTLGNLAPGDEGAFMVTLDVPGTMPTGTEVITSNCASITTPTPDSDPDDNEACVGPVDVWEDDVEIEVDKWPSPSDPTPGQEFIYTIQWCNNRGAAAGPAWLTDTLPLSTTLVSWEPDSWWRRFWVEVSATNEQLVLYAPGLPGDRCNELYLTLSLDPDAPISTTLENEVVIATADDVYWDNDYRVNDEAHVSPPRYDMRLEKSFHSGVLVPGGWINYFFHYFNEGNVSTSISIEDVLPDGLSYDYAFWGGDLPDEGESLPDPSIVGKQVTWDLGEVPVNGSKWFHVQVNITDTISLDTTITNCATISITGGYDDTPENNTSCYSDTINDTGPNLRVTKSHSWDGDGQLDYDVRFENIGDQTVSDVWITDTLPAGTIWNDWWDMDFDSDRLDVIDEITTAAGQLSASAPEPLSPTLQNIPFANAAFGGLLPFDPITFTLTAAEVISPTNFEGCNPWPAGTFTGKTALISRGACEFGVKVLNAETAGAEFVIIHNDAEGGDALVLMAPGSMGDQVTIPSVFVGHTDGRGLVNWYQTHGDASKVTLLVATQSNSMVRWNFSELYPGDSGWLHFEADLDEPGVLMQWFTNTVEISTPLGDTTPDDNTYIDEAFSGMAQLMVWIDDPDGNPANGHVAIWDEWGGFVASSGGIPDRPAMFGDLEVGESYWVQAWPPFTERPDWANSVKEWVTLGDEMIVFTLAFQHPNITGVIKTPEGDPLPPMYDGEENPTYPATADIHNDDWSIDLQIATNPDGEFGMAMPDDDYILRGSPQHELVLTYTKSLPHEVTEVTPTQNLGDVKLTYPRVWGTVVTPEGDRVSTWVSLWREDGEYWDGDDTYGPPDDEEPFRLGGMPTGHYFVQAEPPWTNPEGHGFSNIHEFDVTIDSWYDPASTKQITLVLQMANFVGDLHFPLDSHCPDCPVEWVDVRLRDLGWTFEHWATTGEDGRFAFSGLGAGDYIVEVFLPAHMVMEWDPPPAELFSLMSSDDQVMRTLYLQPAMLTKHVVGKVLYDDGAPVGDAWVYAYHEDSGAWTGNSNDPDGSYDLDLKGGLWKLGVEPMYPGVDWYFDPDVGEQWVWFPYTPTLELTKTVFFTVTRAEFFDVTGRVEDPDGDPPPPGATGVDLCTDEGDCFGAMVEASGRFTVPVLPGAYRVWVWVDTGAGFLPPLDNGFPVFVDGNLDLGVLQLRDPAERTATVSGRVIITPTGQGAVGVDVEAWTDEGDWASTETITEGNYVLDLFPGHWHGGPVLSPWQEENFVVLPPRHQHGYLETNEVISNVNFYLRYRDATIQGQVVNEVGEIITDPTLSAVVFAEYCPPNLPCWIVDEKQVQGSSFELRVVGGMSYTLGIWLQSPGYMPGPPEDVHVGVGETKTGVQLTLIEAGTRIWGELRDGETGERVQIEASVYGSDSEGEYWAEDYVWPGKEPYQYDLYVPTPDTDPVTWTLGLWVDPSTGYIADPATPDYRVIIEVGRELAWQPLKVKKLDTIISGTVWLDSVGGAPAPYIWVFAEGVEGADSEGLYFETETDENGDFSMYVLPGKYLVSAYLPPHLADDYFPPQPMEWDSVDDNPANLVFRPRAGQEVEISGGLAVIPSGSVADDAHIFVFGWTDENIVSIVTGTLAGGYHLPVISNTTWHVWAAYEDLENNAFYYTPQVIDVEVSDTAVTGIHLVLVREDFELPDPECWTFDPAQFKRLSLPAWGNLPEPLVEIQAGTMPVSGTVEVCATPVIAAPGGQRLIGFAYEMEARDSQGNLITQDFNQRVRFIFYFDEDALGDTDPEEVEVGFYSVARQEWVSLDDLYIDPEDMFATGKIGHFTRMGVMSPPAKEGPEGTIKLTSVEIAGPDTGVVSTTYTFTATIGPITATVPFTYAWQATGALSATHFSTSVTDTAAFSWTVESDYVVTVTAANAHSTATMTHTITIAGYNIYLPLVLKNS